MLWKNKLLIKILYCFKNRKHEFDKSNDEYIKIIISNLAFYVPNYNGPNIDIKYFWFNVFRIKKSREELITPFKTFAYDISSLKEDIKKCLRIMNVKQ